MYKNIFLALGSNLGDSKANLIEALELLRMHIRVVAYSSIYITKPYGPQDQNSFSNMVIEGNSELEPMDLLVKLLDVEEQMGRRRSEKWGPRLIDIDILFWDDQIIDNEKLKIPHYDYQNRDFFIIPAAEIAPLFVPPDTKQKLAAMAEIIPIETIISREHLVEPIYRG